MIGGTELFLLVVGCDLALGPLISLVIYNSRKSRRKLVIDYTIVGVVQLAAHGLRRLHRRRHAPGVRGLQQGPARSGDRARHHATRSSRRRAIPHTRICRSTGRVWWRSRYRGKSSRMRCSSRSPETKNTSGRSSTRHIETALAKIRKRAKTVGGADERSFPLPRRCSTRPCASSRFRPRAVRWLPVHHRLGFWTALIDIENGKPVA